MGYLSIEERDARLARVRELLKSRGLDAALIYYDDFNAANGWYLTGWCPLPQFETAAVLVPRSGEPMLLGGPESEPFAKLDSAITETRNLHAFMVPDEEYPNATITDFGTLFAELKSRLGKIAKIGLVGGARMPYNCRCEINRGFASVELVDFNAAYTELRYAKSNWERGQIRAAFALADHCHAAMKAKVAAGVSEIEVAAAGENAARSRGASGFGFPAIIGSGIRSNAVVPTASSKKLEADELVLVGMAPKVRGYAGVVGDVFPVSGQFTPRQAECHKHLCEALRLTKEQLRPGKIGTEIDAAARAYFDKHDFLRYLVCPFVHTIGLHEAETPFFGPNSRDVLKPGMTVCIDVSFFGHPEFNGVRIETGYEITDQGPVALSKKMDTLFCKGL
jgi:Xaa-Pro aminopeptidase